MSFNGKTILNLILITGLLFLLLNPVRASEELFKAVQNNDAETVIKLIEESPDLVNSKDDNDFTPLHWAVKFDSLEAGKALIDGGADVNIKSEYNGVAPIHRVMSLEMAMMLVDGGADVNITDDMLYTPLHFASQDGFKDIVMYLLEKNASIDNKTETGYSPLHLAAQNNHKEIAEYLIEKGADISDMPLQYAAFTGNLEKIRELLDDGMDINNKDNIFGITPLHWACSKEMAQFLIENGADINATDTNGETPLHMASGNGQIEVVSLLIENGADVNAENSYVSTPLYRAAGNGHTDVIGLLIENGALIEGSGEITPLHVAVMNCHIKAVKLLIEKGADVNAKAASGMTALHFAAQNDCVEIAELLIENGADINAKDSGGKTPLDNATSNEMTELLIEK